MTDDIAAVVERVHLELSDYIFHGNWQPSVADVQALCDFATARLAPVHQDEVIARALGVPLDDARLAEPPADLVTTIITALNNGPPPSWSGFREPMTEQAHRILAALAGRILAPGMVAVPLADLRAGLHRAGTIDGLNALARLRTIAEEAGHE